MNDDSAHDRAEEVEEHAAAAPSDSGRENLDIAPITPDPMVAFSDPVPPMAAEVALAAPFGSARVRSIPRAGDTEDLLNGLIAECHFLMRDVALPTAVEVRDADTRARFLNLAMEMAKTGATVGKTVARLRGAGSVTEIRQRHISERLITGPAPLREEGAKT